MSPPTFDKRRYAREYARRKRAQKLATQRAAAALCPFRLGRFMVCGAVLEISVDRSGKTVTRCFKCERRLAGICQDCPRPVEGRVRSALRCAGCKKAAFREACRLYRQRHLEEVRAKDAAHQRRYRLANPEKGRMYARRYSRLHRVACCVAQRRWRKENPIKARAIQKRQWRTRKRKLRLLAQGCAA